MKLLITTYRYLVLISGYLQPVFLLAIRLFCGYQLIVTGYGHLSHLDKVTEFFESLHIPMAHTNAIVSGTTEMVGGALWLIGLGTRAISIALLFNFCVAYWTASRDAVTGFFSNADPFLQDTAFPFLMTSIILLAFGPGFFSVDNLLKRTIFRNKTSALASDS